MSGAGTAGIGGAGAGTGAGGAGGGVPLGWDTGGAGSCYGVELASLCPGDLTRPVLPPAIMN